MSDKAVVTSLMAGAIMCMSASNPCRADDSSASKPAGQAIPGQPGAAATGVAKDKSGVWSELPRPDASWAALSNQKDRKQVWHLTGEEQNKILRSRIKTGMMMGSFYEYNNLLYCSGESFLMTTSVDVSKARLSSVHMRDYKPTVAELFETEARQTNTTIKYDPTFLSKWIAVPPAMPLPYSVKIADGWRADDRGFYVSYIPKPQPVGMDVYMLGRYSGLSSDQALKVIQTNALNFAKMLDKTATLDKMKKETVDGCDALYFETKAPGRPDCQWRQWSFIKNGEALVIVSSIDGANAATLVPDVMAMVASFHVLEPGPSSPGL